MVYCYSSILVCLKTKNMDKQIPTKLSFTGHGRRPLTRLNINWNTFHFFFYCSNTWNWTPLEEDQQKTIRTILIVPGIHPLVSPRPVQLATPAGPLVVDAACCRHRANINGRRPMLDFAQSIRLLLWLWVQESIDACLRTEVILRSLQCFLHVSHGAQISPFYVFAHNCSLSPAGLGLWGPS